MSKSTPSESDLLTALAQAKTTAEQSALISQLEEVRAASRAQAEQARLSSLVAPQLSHLSTDGVDSIRHTSSAASDWLGEVEAPTVERSEMEHAMRAEATVWLERRPEQVRADGGEFRTQAKSKANHLSNRYPGLRTEAAQAFLDQIQHLAAEDWARPGDDDVTVPKAEQHEQVEFDGDTTDEDAETSASDSPSLSEGTEPESDEPMSGDDHAPMDESGLNAATDRYDGDSTVASRKTASHVYQMGEWALETTPKGQFHVRVVSDPSVIAPGSNRVDVVARRDRWGSERGAAAVHRSKLTPIDQPSEGLSDDFGWGDDGWGKWASRKTSAKVCERCGSDQYDDLTPIRDTMGNQLEVCPNCVQDVKENGEWTGEKVLRRSASRKTGAQVSKKDLKAGDSYRDESGQVFSVVSNPILRDYLGLGDEEWDMAIADGGGNGYWDSWGKDEDPKVEKVASRKMAAEGQTCSVCGDKIAKDPEGGGGYHHDNGEKHDHEAKPGKESSRKTAINADSLNREVDFDSPFSVDSQGNVETHVSGYYAPEVYHIDASAPNDVEIGSSDWEAWSTGRSGQYGYRGAVMHASEQLAGGLARDLLNEPGVYVITTVEDLDDMDNPAGWIVLKHRSARVGRKSAASQKVSNPDYAEGYRAGTSSHRRVAEKTVALVYERGSDEVYDRTYNWESAQSYVLEGYVAIAVDGDGGRSREEIQSMLDSDMAAYEDLWGEPKWRPSDLFGSTVSRRKSAASQKLVCGSCGHTWNSRAQYRIKCPKCGAEESVRRASRKGVSRKVAHNGWTNWDTWNASVWLNNEEGIYRAAMETNSPQELRDLVEDIGLTGDGFDPDKVNWDEVWTDNEYGSGHTGSRKTAASRDIDDAWDTLVNLGVAEETVRVVTSINGLRMDVLEDILYYRTGYRSFDQLSDD